MSPDNRQKRGPTSPKGVSASRYSPKNHALLFAAAAAGFGWAYFAFAESSDAITISLVCLVLILTAATRVVVGKGGKSINAPLSVAPERKLDVVAKNAFVALGERMIHQSRRHQQPLSVLVLELHDLPELKELFGTKTASQLVSRLINSLHTLAPARSVVVRSEAEVFTVFLPGLREEAAREVVKRTFGHTISVEIDAQEQEIVLLPDFRIDIIRRDVPSFQGWYEETLRKFQVARVLERRRQHHLRLEHESHCTKPSSLTDVRPVSFGFVQHEHTIPIPMGVR